MTFRLGTGKSLTFFTVYINHVLPSLHKVLSCLSKQAPTTNVVVTLSFLMQYWLTGCCVPDQCVPEYCVWDFLSYVFFVPDRYVPTMEGGWLVLCCDMLGYDCTVEAQSNELTRGPRPLKWKVQRGLILLLFVSL